MFKNYTFVSFPPVKQENNNSILTAPRAMPFKGANSSGDSVFADGRAVYMKTLDLTLKNLGPSKTQTVINKKKFYGGTNRDASVVIDRNRAYTIGTTTNELGGNISFS
jgi:hypothetical protein